MFAKNGHSWCLEIASYYAKSTVVLTGLQTCLLCVLLLYSVHIRILKTICNNPQAMNHLPLRRLQTCREEQRGDVSSTPITLAKLSACLKSRQMTFLPVSVVDSPCRWQIFCSIDFVHCFNEIQIIDCHICWQGCSLVSKYFLEMDLPKSKFLHRVNFVC